MALDLTTAYDGMSKRRQRRALKPLERDILTRILTDILGELRESRDLDSLMFASRKRGIRLNAEEVPLLLSIRDAIDPRPL
jgi:hypothetical protein